MTLKQKHPALIMGRPAGGEGSMETIGLIPVEAENLIPDNLRELNNEAIRKMALRCGNREYLVEDFFNVEGEYSDEIEMRGDFRNFKNLGMKMGLGCLRVKGDVGMHAGAEMSGGDILIEGNTGDWLGAEMKGGFIRVRGNAGNYTGSAYRGNKLGMNGGVVLIEGNTGFFTGDKMRRGEIIVLGDAGDFTGSQMVAGSIYLFGRTGKRTGAGMKRGSIISFFPLTILPSFEYSARYKPNYIRIALRRLKELYGISCEDKFIEGEYMRYAGDFTETGKGELLVWAKQN
jgi:formylmethanofuran dehydrogenase subunit C